MKALNLYVLMSSILLTAPLYSSESDIDSPLMPGSPTSQHMSEKIQRIQALQEEYKNNPGQAKNNIVLAAQAGELHTLKDLLVANPKLIKTTTKQDQSLPYTAWVHGNPRTACWLAGYILRQYPCCLCCCCCCC